VAGSILFSASLASLTLATAPLLFLFWLMQPATRANPGVGAYNPPFGTLLGPIAHREEAIDPPSELSSATNFARAYVRAEMAEDATTQEAKVSAKRDTRLAKRKQSRVGHRRKFEQSAHAYAQGWDNHWQLRYR
jgi:hypothetical protein